MDLLESVLDRRDVLQKPRSDSEHASVALWKIDPKLKAAVTMCFEVVLRILHRVEPRVLELGTDTLEELEVLAIFEDRIPQNIVCRSEVLAVDHSLPASNMAIEGRVETARAIEDGQWKLKPENNQSFELRARKVVLSEGHREVLLEPVELGSDLLNLTFQ